MKNFKFKIMALMMCLSTFNISIAQEYGPPDDVTISTIDTQLKGDVEILNAQSPGDVIDEVNEADDWTTLIGLYEMMLAALTILLTQIGKVIPGIKKIPPVYVAIGVTLLIVGIGISKFGTGSLASIPIVWTFATLIYKEILKPKEVVAPPQTQA